MPALPLLPFVPRAAAGALLCGFAASALAGVIPGTGAAPSATQLGATDAVALQRSTSYRGHVLLTPYFTAQSGQMTVLHLVNTDRDNGKAIKLRLRGSVNGDSVLSMTVLLSPGDMWTAAITAGPDGRGQLTTADESCTVPRLAPGVPQPLQFDRLRPNIFQGLASETREGAVEAILAADIPSGKSYGSTGADYSPLQKALSPASAGPRCDDTAIDAALLQDIGDESSAAAQGFATPSGGISGTWYIIDVPGATTFSSGMTALEAVNQAGQPARGNYVLFPATDQAIAQPERYTADPLLVSAGLAGRQKSSDGVLTQPTTAAVLQARAYDLPDLSTPYRGPASPVNAARTAAEVSRVLAAREVSNQFSLDPSISARTDWVVATPTLRYSAAVDYTTGQATFSAVPPAGEGPQYLHSGNVRSNGGQLCWFGNAFFYTHSRSQLAGTRPFITVPPSTELCGAGSVMFAQQSTGDTYASVLHPVAANAGPVPAFTATAGWVGLRFLDTAGMPVIGDAFTKLVNPSVAPGMAASYGLLYPHAITRP